MNAYVCGLSLLFPSLALFHIYDDNIALITTTTKASYQQQPTMLVAKEYRESGKKEWWIFSFESNDDDVVERSEISGKEKLKKFAFHLLSCFSPLTWKKLIFLPFRLLSTPKSSCFKPQNLFFLNAPCQYSSSLFTVNAKLTKKFIAVWNLIAKLKFSGSI